MSSAPSAVSARSRSWSRPAPTTRPAPSRLATCTAIAPALPVAPRTRTLCPGSIGTRRRSATHDDIAGFIAAASFATSASSGSSIDRRSRRAPCPPSCRSRRRRPRSRSAGRRVAGRRRRFRGSSATCRCWCSGRRRRRSDARMQADGKDVDEHLVTGARLRHLELLVVRWLVERRHHGCVHDGHVGASPASWFSSCHVPL